MTGSTTDTPPFTPGSVASLAINAITAGGTVEFVAKAAAFEFGAAEEVVFLEVVPFVVPFVVGFFVAFEEDFAAAETSRY